VINQDRVAVLARALAVHLGKIMVQGNVSPHIAFNSNAATFNIYGGKVIWVSGSTAPTSTELLRFRSPTLEVDRSKAAKFLGAQAVNDKRRTVLRGRTSCL
jgi:hypothetical protein